MIRLSSHRRGAALIIALVILAAMLMLGLPFLFTQSASLTGTRNFAQNQQARLGHESAESLGMDIAASAMSYHMQYPSSGQQDDWTSLYWGLGGPGASEPHLTPVPQNPSSPPGTIVQPNPNHVGIDLSTLGAAFPYITPSLTLGAATIGSTSTLGLMLEDEAGKLDPNTLDATAWSTLLTAVGIQDWPAETTTAPTAGDNALAQALAQLRYPPTVAGQPGVGGRITALEQLQLANPYVYTSPSARGPLTPAELALLRPHLSFANRASGRAGPRLADAGFQLSGPFVSAGTWANPVAAYDLTLIDLGSLVSVAGGALHIDSLPPARMLSYPPTPFLIGAGTALVVEDKTSVNGTGSPLQIEHIIPASQNGFTAGLQAEWPVGIAASAALNLHQADAVVCTVLDGVTPADTITTLGNPPALNPDSWAGANGLTNASFQCGASFPQTGTATSSAAFTLLNPLATTVVLAKGVALPSLLVDPGVPSNATAIGPYVGTQDSLGALRPTLLATALVIHVQGAATFSALPSTGWAQLVGAQAPTLTSGVTEYVYYTGLSINSPTMGQTTINVLRGQVWNNAGGQPQSFFTDSIPSSLGPAVPPATPLTITFFGPHELPPLAIASRGVVTVEASSTIADSTGHQVASRARRVIAQAVPQEYQLEERWQTQAQLQALVASRQGSLMTTFPEPYPRLSDVFPLDSDPASASTLDSVIGLRPATLRTLLSSTVLAHDWALPFSGPKATFLTSMVGVNANFPTQATPGTMPLSPVAAAAATAGTAFSSLMTPEGLLCTPSGAQGAVYLAYQVTAPNDHGPLGLMDVVPTATGATVANNEIPSRQLGLWVRPNTSWSGAKQVVIMEMRMPIANAGLPFSGTTLPSATLPQSDVRLDPTGGVGAAPNTSLQNYWSLYYDASDSGKEQLVLCFANSAIEHPFDYGPLLPPYDPSNSHFDNRSLGGGTLPLAPARPMNRIEFRYRYTLTPGTWHLIQVAYARDTPGSHAIMVDGLVGTDIAQSGSMTMTNPGDHITLPCLILNQALSASTYPTTVQSPDPLDLATDIQVLAWAPGGGSAGAESILPQSGYVRIGNEYLSYDGLAPAVGANTLKNCRRGQRQDTSIAGVPALANVWPTIPAHAVGDLVVPGGYRLHNVTGTLLRGGCTLAPLNGSTAASQPGIWPGDQSSHNQNLCLLWGTVGASQKTQESASGQPVTIPSNPPTVPPTNDPVLVYDPIIIHMTGSTGAFDPTADPNGTWPIRGYAKVVLNTSSATMTSDYQRIFYYDNTGFGPPSTTVAFMNVLTLVMPTTTGSLPTQGPWPSPIDVTTNNPAVVMISAEILAAAGVDPTNVAAARYNVGSPLTTVGASNLVQFYDQAGAGEIEWLSYNWLASTFPVTAASSSAIGHYFLVNFNGFPWYGYGIGGNQRGMQRTRGPIDPVTGLVAVPFPSGSRVLPVQTVVSGLGVVRTGDVLTIAPSICQTAPTSGYLANTTKSGTKPISVGPATWQAVVRYSPMDGFGTTSDATTWLTADDTINPYFAFTEELPAAFGASGAFDLLCWPCWNGVNMSPTSGYTLPTTTSSGTTALLSSVSSLMPCSNAFASGYLQSGTTDDRRIYIASADDRVDHGAPSTMVIMQGTLDAVHGGAQTAMTGSVATEVTATIGASESVNPVDGAVWINGLTLSAIQSITVQPTIGVGIPATYGLVLIGGEVFAYRQHINQLTVPPTPTSNLDLIGRSLMGSSARQHAGRENLVFLPLGPVAPLNAALPATTEGLLPLPANAGVIDAPAVLIVSPDGSHSEAISAPDGYTAPWLRGLYDTCAPDLNGGQAWNADAASGLYPLAIGWWPRYASALPNATSPQWTGLTPAQQSSALRSRSYAWAGFPLRFYDLVFPNPDPIGSLGSISLFDDAGQAFTVYARALASGFDWNRPDVLAAQIKLLPIPAPTVFGALPEAAATPTAIDPLFLTDQFAPVPTGGSARQAVPVDGAEVRVFWRYTTFPAPGSTTADWVTFTSQSNVAPTLGPAVMRCRAPAKIIAVDSAR